MKKVLVVVLMIVVGSLSLLASEAMQKELLHYWQTNGIPYYVDENGMGVDVSNNIAVVFTYDNEFVHFVFSVFATAKEINNFILNESLLPYSVKFKHDVVKTLNEYLTFYTQYGFFPTGRYVWLDNYYAFVAVIMLDDYIYLMVY